MEQYDSRVDAYIAKSAPFAQPILQHIRQIVHQASPLITETIKWGMPFFDYKGSVCHMAAFKAHCAMGFWKGSRLNDTHHVLNTNDESAMGSFGRITCIGDLPNDEALIDLIQQAITLNEQGVKVHIRKAPAEKKELIVPDYFIHFLSHHPKAQETFEQFRPSHKKEYVEWITEAKTDATREKRMQQAVEMMSEGKTRNWKYNVK